MNHLLSAISHKPNQRGLSSLVLLFTIVIGVIMLWEVTEYIRLFTNPPIPSQITAPPSAPTERFCATGEEGNCNDSNDQFIFNG